MPSVSIIVPVYKTEQYLPTCIDSILTQTFADFELLLIDDGSPDKCGIICDEYAEKDHRVHVIHKENGGVSSARNAGLNKVQGEYVVFCDSDDKISPSFINELMSCPSSDYVIEGFSHIYNNEMCFQSPNMAPSIGTNYKCIPDDFFILGFMHSCCGKRYKTKIIKENNITFPNVRLSEDSLFNLLYLTHIRSWQIIKKCDYCYIHRSNHNSATSKYSVKDIDAYILLHQQMNSIGIKKSVVKNTLYTQYLACLMKCYKSDFSWDIRKSQMKGILSRASVRNTILFTKRNFGEWLTGLVYCTCNQHLINTWEQLILRT